MGRRSDRLVNALAGAGMGYMAGKMYEERQGKGKPPEADKPATPAPVTDRSDRSAVDPEVRTMNRSGQAAPDMDTPAPKATPRPRPAAPAVKAKIGSTGPVENTEARTRQDRSGETNILPGVQPARPTPMPAPAAPRTAADVRAGRAGSQSSSVSTSASSRFAPGVSRFADGGKVGGVGEAGRSFPKKGK